MAPEVEQCAASEPGCQNWSRVAVCGTAAPHETAKPPSSKDRERKCLMADRISSPKFSRF